MHHSHTIVTAFIIASLWMLFLPYRIQGGSKATLPAFRPHRLVLAPSINTESNRLDLLDSLTTFCADRADELHKDFCDDLIKLYTGEMNFKDIFSSKRQKKISTLLQQLFDRLVAVCANVAMQYPLEICQLATREKTLSELVNLSDEDQEYFLQQLMFKTASRVHKNHLQVWKDLITISF